MTAEEVVSCWKDEACRGRYAADVRARLPDNPAGPSPLDRAELDATGGSLPDTIRVGSVWLSCTLACAETMWDGSCDFFTYGCCP